jgi:hypothetical protein
MALAFVVNLTVGLVLAVVMFTVYVAGVIYAYKASLLMGLAFFAVAMLGAIAMVFTYIVLIYGTLAGGIYLIVRSAQARLERGAPTRQHYRMTYAHMRQD